MSEYRMQEREKMADNHQNQVPEAEAVATAKKEEAFRISQVIYDWAGTLLFAAAVILLIMTFFFRQVTVKGSSMNDTLADRERLLRRWCLLWLFPRYPISIRYRPW